jgi:hypothetical protein
MAAEKWFALEEAIVLLGKANKTEPVCNLNAVDIYWLV